MLLSLPTQRHTIKKQFRCVRCEICAIFPQTALQTDAPGCLLRTNVTILSTEKKTKSNATLLKEQKASALALVRRLLFKYFMFLKDTQWILDSVFNPVCVLLYMALLLPELLTVQSAEENDFVIKYSPEVWKGNVNVWLGMYYDTNSKYRVSGGLWKQNFHNYYSLWKSERKKCTFCSC